MRKGGAYIVTNSWGGGFPATGGYYSGSEIDGYLYDNMVL
jgi:hypothetical protein